MKFCYTHFLLFIGTHTFKFLINNLFDKIVRTTQKILIIRSIHSHSGHQVPVQQGVEPRHRHLQPQPQHLHRRAWPCRGLVG